MNTLACLQESLTRTAEKIEKYREAFFADPENTKTIHHFRTNIRSLRSQVAFIKPWQDSAQNAETQAILKEIVSHTSLLRELDVFEKQARSNPDSSAELLAFCKEEASDERTKVLKILSSKRVTRSFKRAMNLAKNVTWKRHYAKHGLSKEAVRERFDAMVESVGAEIADLKLWDEEQTHDVRKRAKRVRYVSEVNAEILGVDAVDIAKGMTAHQDDLGDVCDARANIRLINGFLHRSLPNIVVWELNLMRAQNETFLYSTLRSAATQ